MSNLCVDIWDRDSDEPQCVAGTSCLTPQHTIAFKPHRLRENPLLNAVNGVIGKGRGWV